MRRRIGLLGVVTLIAAAAVLSTTRHHSGPRLVSAGPPPRAKPAARRRFTPPSRLAEQPRGALGAPVQDAAAAALSHGRIMLLGGLTAADTSTDAIGVVAAGRDRSVGRLAGGLHDAAAVGLGGSVYLFGGGNGSSQADAIVRVSPGGRAVTVAHLPAPSSDQAAATLDGTAYVVGGYTGTRWLDTVVAWRPGGRARVVAHLPTAVRYAAVAAAEGRIVIAGGSLPDGTASDAVLAFDPRTRRVSRLGRLPAPTTHAAAAGVGGVVYVIGGRGAALDTPTARVVAVDVRARRIRLAGRLAAPRSDLAAVAVGDGILLAGGHGASGTVSTLAELVAIVDRPAGARAAAPDVYAHDRPDDLTAVTRRALSRVYVPNSASGTVDVIDPRTFRVVEHFAVGTLPQHVVPAYDLRTLYVTNDMSNSLTAIDPETGKPGRTIPVADPYNMYFTPDGRYAIVVAERLARLDFHDPHSFRLRRSLHMPCVGVDHMDFSADGSYALASCEFSGQIVKVGLRPLRVAGVLRLPDGRGGMPQDVKLSPDGAVFYVADQQANGLWEIDGDRLKTIGFLPTGLGVHGLYPSRDGRFLYATNRREGSISVISFARRRQVAKWRIPGGGSPDMGGVSADGNVLWLSGRYDAVVYAISTRTGKLLARVPVGLGPHGLCVWPQPGRYSLGHTGVMR